MTISKGSDKVDLNAMDLTQMTGEDARLLLEQKGLTVEVREENSDTVIKGNVIRFSPQVVKVGEGVSLYVSKGSQNVEGRVPNLQGQTSTSADAPSGRSRTLNRQCNRGSQRYGGGGPDYQPVRASGNHTSTGHGSGLCGQREACTDPGFR